ncbi:MAG: putative glycosyltransferase [Edaphobacter sp.]|nr:putative glycosyltransferase [Edaphobacter sp.]
MQNDRPLLTIAISTYNRPSFLNELLSCLLEQCISDPGIELFVSDNTSTHQTSAIVAGYVDRGLQIRYLRNKSNIGADANVMQCFDKARGKYVWLIGDEDLIVPGAIGKIIFYMQAGNSYCFEGAAAPKGVEFSWPPRVIKDAHRFVCSIHVNFTFVSDNIINEDRVMASDPIRLSSLVGTNLMQLGWIYAALNRYILYFREKLVGMRTNDTVGYTLSQVIGPNLKKIADRPQTSEEYYQWDIMRFLPAAFNHW